MKLQTQPYVTLFQDLPPLVAKVIRDMKEEIHRQMCRTRGESQGMYMTYASA